MEVVAVRVRKKDGTSFIKVLVDSEQSPISMIRNEQWLEHNGKKYKFGFNFSEEFFEEIRKVEVEELRSEQKVAISKEELKRIIKELLKEIKEEEKQGN